VDDAIIMLTSFDLMVAVESTIGELYAIFAEQFPADAAVWHELAEDEVQHARWLRELQKAVEDNLLDFDPTVYHLDLLRHTLGYVRTLKQEALAKKVSHRQAIHEARTLEKMLVEKYFFEVVVDHNQLLQHVFAALTDATVHHTERLNRLHASWFA